MVRIAKPRRQRTHHFIAAWREYRELTQEQLAGRVDMSRENLSKIESGKVPYRQDFLEACAVALDTSKSDLLERDPRMEKMVDELRDIVDRASETDRKEIIRFAKYRLEIKE
jgi:transcriptional regulator with XRE-family HTH domain